MSKEELRKCRCLDCGEIGWMKGSKGCENCFSLHIEHFTEPKGYVIYRHLVHDVSSQLARLVTQPPTASISDITDKYLNEVISATENLSLAHPYCKDWAGKMAHFLYQWSEGLIMLDEVLSRIIELWRDAVFLDEQITRTFRTEIYKWLMAQLSAGRHSIGRVSLIVDADSLISALITEGREPARPIALAISPRDSELLSWVLEECIKASGGIVSLESAVQPGHAYARVPFNFHINLSELTWKLLQDSVKIAPIIILLVRAELPYYAEAVGVAETIRSVVSNIKKLREDHGEVCIYQAIVYCRKSTGEYPSAHEIYEEINKYGCFSRKCKLYNEETGHCSIKQSTLDSTLAFLKEQKIIKKISAEKWWVCF